MCAQQYDDDNKKQDGGITRRGFMQFMGAGALGVSMAGAALSRTPPANAAPPPLKAAEMAKIHLRINGASHPVLVEPRWTLLYVLREVLGLTGTKIGCGRGECGACTVLINDIPRYACITLAVEAENSKIITLEGVMEGEALGPVQQAFVEQDAFQCGYCTPGQVMAVEGLLRKNSDPGIDEIRKGVSGNLCRCGAYNHIFRAAKTAAKRKKE